MISLRSWFRYVPRLTSMPWAGQTAIRRKHTVLEGGAVMGAIGTESVGSVADPSQEDLAALETFELDFTFLPALQV